MPQTQPARGLEQRLAAERISPIARSGQLRRAFSLATAVHDSLHGPALQQPRGIAGTALVPILSDLGVVAIDEIGKRR